MLTPECQPHVREDGDEMRVVPDTFSPTECEDAVKYGTVPHERWCILFESELEAEMAMEALKRLVSNESSPIS